MVEKLSNAVKTAASAVFVSFTQMNVADETAMRRSLRGEKVMYTVVKKSLMKRALEGLGHAHKEVPLEGELALVYQPRGQAGGGGDDATTAARLIHEFVKKFKDKLVILGGVFEGKLLDKAAMTVIATIPPLQTLRGMFVNVINSPIQGLAVVLKAYADLPDRQAGKKDA